MNFNKAKKISQKKMLALDNNNDTNFSELWYKGKEPNKHDQLYSNRRKTCNFQWQGGEYCSILN